MLSWHPLGFAAFMHFRHFSASDPLLKVTGGDGGLSGQAPLQEEQELGKLVKSPMEMVASLAKAPIQEEQQLGKLGQDKCGR